MTESDDFEARVETELNATLAAEKVKLRARIVDRLRREAFARDMDRINARAPIENQFSGLSREQHEARLKMMSERSAQTNREMDESNAKVVDGSLRASRAAGKGGAAGFTIK
jgi:hypothetical protein